VKLPYGKDTGKQKLPYGNNFGSEGRSAKKKPGGLAGLSECLDWVN
jgi:hypothetical protein